jgi:hypothetical protein
MIDLTNFILHTTKRKKPRYHGEVNTEKRYYCTCEECGKFRGYIKKTHYNKKPLCKRCKVNVNKKKISNSLRQYYNKNPRHCDPKLKLLNKIKGNLRNRLNKAINGNYKTGSAVKDLGCSIEDFKLYMESQFQPGMSWDNHTVNGWHIDHIIPLSKFDLTDHEKLKKACHYSNLRPLWAKDNLSKSDKVCGD